MDMNHVAKMSFALWLCTVFEFIKNNQLSSLRSLTMAG